MVSICLLTYKHEAYIKKAIESVLEQETDFPCEFIIADDCSPDNTRSIIKSFAEQYPIKLIFQERNVGMQRNLKSLLDAPSGKYVAFFEGDDHWIDPLKLKKQVSILEENPHIVVCYANAELYDTRNPEMKIYFTDNKPLQVLDCYNAVTAFTIPTCTIFFRNVVRPLPEWIYGVRACEYMLVALLCKHGKAYYMDECLGLYLHDYTGLSRVIGQEHYLYDDAIASLNLYEHYDKDPEIWESIVQKYIINIDKLFYRGWPNKARSLFWKWSLREAWKAKRKRNQILKLIVKLHFPFFISLRKIFLSIKNKKKAMAYVPVS